MEFVARFLGRALRYTYEVVEYTPTSSVMRTAAGPFPMENDLSVRGHDRGAHPDDVAEPGHTTRLLAVHEPFMRIAVRRANRKDLKALKVRLEE